MPSIIYIIFFLFCCLTTQAQHPFAWQLTAKEGLPSMEVYDLYQDKKGYMWIGTDKGLCKYNGSDFYYYHNEQEKGLALSGIQEDNEGRVWVRNFRNQIFYVEGDSMHYFKELELMGVQEIRDFLLDSKGNVWMFESQKNDLFLYLQDKKEWIKYSVSVLKGKTNAREGIYNIIESANYEFFITTSEGLFKWAKDSIAFLTKENLVVSNISGIDVLTTGLYNFYGKLFLGQYYNDSKHEFQLFEYNNKKINPLNNVLNKKYWDGKIPHNIRLLTDSTVWQISLNAGVVPILNLSSQQILDTSLVLFPNEGISDILIDHEGNYWISSLKNGIYIVPNLHLMHCTANNSIFDKEEVRAIANSSNENLLVGTNQGKVYSYNTNSESIDHYYKIPKGNCNFVLEENKKIMAQGISYQYFFELKDSLFSAKNIIPEGTKNISFYQDSLVLYNMGTVGFRLMSYSALIPSEKVPAAIFSTLRTAIYIDPIEKIEIYSKFFDHKRCNWVLADNANKRFFVAWVDSLVCYSEKGADVVILDDHQKLIEATHLVFSENGLMWLCSNNKGIYALNKDLKVVHHFTTKDGLLDNKIKKIVIDKGNLWLLSHHGIQFFNPITKESNTYTLFDGLPTSEIMELVIIKNKVWLRTAEGLVFFDKNMTSKNNIAPPVFIKKIAIHEKKQTLKASYQLSYIENTLTIYIEGISYKSQGSFVYKYRMLGLDTTWIRQTSRTNFVRFPQLNPGTYLFEVKAVNEDGVESVNAARVQFIIRPPYWQTWWFQGGLYLLGILMVVGGVLFRIRVKQVEERQQNKVNVLRMQALQSQMNPHFIFNVLTAVQNMWLQKKNEGAMEMQSIFAKLLRKIFQYSGQTVISIEQEEDFLNNYLNLEQIRFENKVEIDFSIEDELLEEDYYIPPLLIQPILENSFKHGLFHKVGDKKLIINLKIEEPYLYCCVEDNGVGRGDKKAEDRVSGLSTTKERLLILQQTAMHKQHPHHNFRITDLFSENQQPIGTKVELWIPFLKP